MNQNQSEIQKLVHSDTQNSLNQFENGDKTDASSEVTGSTLVIDGQIDEMKTSPVRRTFLLIVLFDLISSCFFYIIYLKLTGKNFSNAFTNDLERFDFNSSLADTIFVSTARFTLLEIVYGCPCIRVQHFWPVAVTTGLSNLFAIIKVILYCKAHIGPYLIIFYQMAICWLETYIMISVVMPREKAALRAESMRIAHQVVPKPIEKSNLEQYFTPLPSDDEEDEDNNRENRDLGLRLSITNRALSNLPNEVKRQYRKRAEDMREFSWKIFNQTNDWKWMSGTVNEKGHVSSKEVAEFPGKTFKVEAVIEGDINLVFKDLTENIEASSEWIETVKRFNVVEQISLAPRIEIVYSVTNETMGGMISSRDFVALRISESKENMNFLTSHSIDYAIGADVCEPNTTRGVWNCNIVALQPITNSNNHFKYTFMINVDMKLSVPKYIINKAMLGVMHSQVAELRNRARLLTSNPSVLLRDITSKQQLSGEGTEGRGGSDNTRIFVDSAQPHAHTHAHTHAHHSLDVLSQHHNEQQQQQLRHHAGLQQPHSIPNFSYSNAAFQHPPRHHHQQYQQLQTPQNQQQQQQKRGGARDLANDEFKDAE